MVKSPSGLCDPVVPRVTHLLDTNIYTQKATAPAMPATRLQDASLTFSAPETYGGGAAGGVQLPVPLGAGALPVAVGHL